MNRLLLTISALSVLAAASCRSTGTESDPKTWDGATIVISVDGFRWDYRDLVETPALDRLAADGVVSNIRPSFPSKTFPSHHTLATGLHPNRHGVVGNTTYDPELGVRFSMGDSAASSDGRWWGGEPIWVSVEKTGLVAATYFWPGTEAEIQGVRPTHWKPYDGDIPGEARVEQVLNWLDVPRPQRPSFLTLYFSDADNAGHDHGPLSEETFESVRKIDGYVGQLMNGLDDLDLEDAVNIVIVGDHGMSQLSPDRVVYFDDYVNPRRAGIQSLGEYVALWPAEDEVDAVFEALDGAHPALTVYRRGSIPERFHLDGSPRTPPIVGVVEEGWSVSTHAWAERREDPYSGGGHGYDNQVPDMSGIFLAHGPAFKSGVAVETLDAVDLYNVLAATLGIGPAENDGDPDVLKRVLR